MNDIKKIANEARRALSKLQNGKTYTSKYVCERLETAKSRNPGDILIGNLRDVFVKRASEQNLFTQKEITSAYDHMYGLSGGRSSFREEMHDLMLPMAARSDSAGRKTASASRIPYEKEIKPLYGDSALSKELSGVFSLDKKASFSALSDTAVNKALKFAKLQLTSLGCSPSDIRAVRANDHFVLCSASVETSDFTQINVPIPVQITNGIPSLPQTFVSGDSLVKLNKENLYVFIKDKNNHTKKVARDEFAGQRARGSLEIRTPGVPSELMDFADLDNQLIAAASIFSSKEVSSATAVVSMELSALGLKNAQVKLDSSTDKTLTYEAKIGSDSSTLSAKISVDMPNGSPVIPTKFSSNGVEYRLNRPGLRAAVASASESGHRRVVSRDIENMDRLNYNQLIGELETGVATSDYKKAENALAVIEARFDSSNHLAAVDHFSKLLKHASGGSERDRLIKAACERGELIHVPTSVHLYSPKLGLPVNKVAFDEKGRLVPATRGRLSSDLSETGAMISTSKISLS